MAKTRAFLLRINPDVLEAVQRWADEDLRSLNGQIEFLLRKVLAESGRGPKARSQAVEPPALSPALSPGQPEPADDDFID